jgi:hypothetical protein
MAAPYNAKCDGTTDDHVAIQAALNTSASVVIPANVNCSIGTVGLILNTGQIFNGNSSQLTYLGTGVALGTNSNTADPMYGAGSITIENLNINLEGLAAGATGIGLFDSYTDSITNVEVFQWNTCCGYFPSTSVGIYGVLYGTNGVILNNVVGGDKIVLQGTTTGQNTNIVFNTVFVFSSGTDGIDVSYSDNTVMTGVVVDGSTCALCLQNMTGLTILGASILPFNGSTTSVGIQIGSSVYELTAVLDTAAFTGIPVTGTSQGGLIMFGDQASVNNLQITGLLTGPATAPSGPCSVIGWVHSQDGHLSYCNGTTWSIKL